MRLPAQSIETFRGIMSVETRTMNFVVTEPTHYYRAICSILDTEMECDSDVSVDSKVPMDMLLMKVWHDTLKSVSHFYRIAAHVHVYG